MIRQAQLRSASVVTDDFSLGVLTMLSVLHHARDLAQEAQRDVWEFAEEASSFWAAGVSNGDLRRLLLKGLILHAEETTTPHSTVRTFARVGNLSLPERTCLVLSKAGEVVARSLALPKALGKSMAPRARGLHKSLCRCGSRPLPLWNADLKELWVDKTLIKHFLRPAPNQEMVLTAFQEQGWIPRIDNPLPRLTHRNVKVCLHDTINHLNRNLRAPLLHFSGDGSGRGIRWRFINTTLPSSNGMSVVSLT